MIIQIYDKMIAYAEPNYKRSIATIKKKIGFSKVNYKITKAQSITETKSDNPPSSLPGDRIPSLTTKKTRGGRHRYGKGAQ